MILLLIVLIDRFKSIKAAIFHADSEERFALTTSCANKTVTVTMCIVQAMYHTSCWTPWESEPANFGVILLLYRGCPLSEVKLYCHGPVGTIELVVYREVNCTVSLIRRVL